MTLSRRALVTILLVIWWVLPWWKMVDTSELSFVLGYERMHWTSEAHWNTGHRLESFEGGVVEIQAVGCPWNLAPVYA